MHVNATTCRIGVLEFNIKAPLHYLWMAVHEWNRRHDRINHSDADSHVLIDPKVPKTSRIGLPLKHGTDSRDSAVANSLQDVKWLSTSISFY